jgi:hypothetical protein
MNERYYLMSGETLEDYFRLLNLDETRRKYLECIKEGKQVDREIEEQLFKNGNREIHSPIAEYRYFMYMKRFVIHRNPNYSPLSRQTQVDASLHGGRVHHNSIFGVRTTLL